MLTSAKISNRDGCISPPHVAHSLFHPQAGIHLCTMGMEHTAINFMSQQCSSVYSRKDKPVEAHGLLQELCVHPAPWQDNTLQKKNSMLLRPETTNEVLSVHGCWSSHWGTEVSTFKQRAVQQAEAIETCADGSAIFPRFSFSRGFNRMDSLGIFDTIPAEVQSVNKKEKQDTLSLFSWDATMLEHEQLGNNVQSCSSLTIEQAQQFHAYAIDVGFELEASLCGSLIDMYVKCQCLDSAHKVFDKLPRPHVVTWNKLIAGYAKQGDGEKALTLFKQMQNEYIQPTRVTLICVLKACTNVLDLQQGRWIHAHIINNGCVLGLFVANTLIDMYAKCGSLEDALIVFNTLPKQDIVAWNVLISGYVQHGHVHEVLSLFQHIQEDGMEPDKVTFVSILKACSIMAALEKGIQFHSLIIESGFESELSIGSTLVYMYAKCGRLEKARILFDRLPERNLVTWGALMTGCAQQGLGQETLLLFEQMQKEGIKPNLFTFVCVLKACSSMAGLEEGKRIHSHLIEIGLELDSFACSTLINMYVKCGSISDAQAMFDRLQKKNVVTWSALIGGYAEHENGLEALQLFKQMQLDGVKADEVTFVYILKACSSIAALGQGKCIHAHIIESGFESDIFVGSALIDMYAKLGSLNDAHMVFGKLPRRDTVTWSALIAGFGQSGDYISALHHFKGMQEAGLQPDDVTFLCLLSACSQVGLADEGSLHFKLMREVYGITPALEHYNTMVDLFGRAGHLNEAEELLDTVPFGPNVVGWTSLLNSCRTHNNFELGRRCFYHVANHGNPAGYVLMSKIYANAGMQDDAEQIEELRRCTNGWKKPAKAFIEIDNQVHEFIVGDKVHPRSEDIYAKLKMISLQMRGSGHKSHFDYLLDSASDEQKADILCGHCENLAIALGLICALPGTTIRVAKNLRMCNDCHNSTKFISKVEMREIIVRDAYCIHHFQDGLCSCNDYC